MIGLDFETADQAIYAATDNLSQFKPISLHQLFTFCPHLTCERA